LPTNPANVLALDAAKNAVPVQRPSIRPPPFLPAIYSERRKKSSAFKEGATPLDKE